MFGLSTTHNNNAKIVSEPYHNYRVLCPECSTSVEGHHSCHKQAFSILQRYEEDDLLLVAIGTQHHDSHHKTVLARKLSWDQCEKCSNSCWLPFGNSSEICVLWKQGIWLLIFLLFVLETSQNPSSLCLKEVTLFVRLDGEHPSSGYIIFRLDFLQVDEIKNLIVDAEFVL